jgi:hypothetical protein
MLLQAVFIREPGAKRNGIPGGKKPNENGQASGKWWRRWKSTTSTVQRYFTLILQSFKIRSAWIPGSLGFPAGSSIR